MINQNERTFRDFLINKAKLLGLEVFCPENHVYEVPSKGLKFRFMTLDSPFFIGIKEIRIWEDQWILKNQIIESRISSLLNINDTLPARVCVTRRIDINQAKSFLDKNHLHNSTGSRINFGLFLPKSYYRLLKMDQDQSEERLVAVMTFSNGKKFYNQDYAYFSFEMLRFASLPLLNIPGGISKLIKAFNREKSPGNIMTYIDKDWSEGNNLKKLGFIEVSHREPVFYKVDTEYQRTMVKKQESWNCYNLGSIKMILNV